MCNRRRKCWSRSSSISRTPVFSWPRRPWPIGGLRSSPGARSKRTARGSRRCWTLSKTPTSWPRWPGRRAPPEEGRFSGGFFAESPALLANGRAKRARKGVPLLVGNIGPATFGQDDNALLLVDADGHRELPRASKRVLAQQLIAEVAARLPPLPS